MASNKEPNDMQLFQQAARREITPEQAAEAMLSARKQSAVSRVSDGFMWTRLSALGVMFFLGAALGRMFALVPWFVWFGLAMVACGFTMWTFLKAADDVAKEP